jgi:nucleotide-binding universal stress UspA family protein
MEPLTRLLVPVDFSIVSKSLVGLAASLSGRYSSEVVLMHVIEESLVDHVSGGYNVTLLVESLQDEARRKLEELKDYAERMGAARVRIYHEVPIADPASAIAGVASEVRASEIIIASKGWGLSRMFSMGSTSRLVVKLSPVPVIFIRALREKGTVKLMLHDGELFGNILYALSREYQEDALEYVMKLASLTGSRLTIVHVLEDGDSPLREVERRISYTGIDVETVEGRGKPHEVILRYARAVGANSLFLERRLHRGLMSLFLGTTLDRVLNGSEVPVIVYPAAGERRR